MSDTIWPSNPGQLRSGRAAIVDGASTAVITAPGSGYKLLVTDVVISNSSSTAAEVNVRDGTGGTVLATYPAPASKNGCVHRLGSPLVLTENTAAAADPDAALNTITVTMLGFVVRA